MCVRGSGKIAESSRYSFVYDIEGKIAKSIPWNITWVCKCQKKNIFLFVMISLNYKCSKDAKTGLGLVRGCLVQILSQYLETQVGGQSSCTTCTISFLLPTIQIIFQLINFFSASLIFFFYPQFYFLISSTVFFFFNQFISRT